MLKVVRIPKDRMPVLIGKKGLVRKEIEDLAWVRIKISDEIEIEGDALPIMNAENVIKAIGRGFSPHKALYLLDEDYTIHVIPLPKNEKTLRRIRSRIIGTKGKARKRIEQITKTFISVYGRTVSIIGKYDDVEKAKTAVENLMTGYSHKSVFKSLGAKHG